MKQTWNDIWAILSQFISGTSHYVGVYAKVGQYAEESIDSLIKEARIESAKELKALESL
jgi:hypothetical protein